MRISSPVQDMPASATLAVSRKARELRAAGVDVVGFGAGEPDFDTPDVVKRAAIAALEAGKTKYAPTEGTPDAREAIARKLREENGIACDASHVTVTVGAKQAIFLALSCLVERGRGDEVVIPTPAWVTYRPLAEYVGARVVEVPGRIEDDWRVNPEALANAITPNTAAIFLNSPSNPCGTAYTPAQLEAIVAALVPALERAPNAVVISDEIYEKLVYPEITPGLAHRSLGSFEAIAGRVLTVNGMSKAWAMTGWRLGYACAPGENGALVKQMIKLQAQMTNAVTSFCLDAIPVALTQCADEVESMRRTFATRAAMVADLLDAIPGLRFARPHGAFYAFPDAAAFIGRTSSGGRAIGSGLDFCAALLEESNVAVVPGDDFGDCARSCFRISFATSEAQIEKGLGRLKSFVDGLS